MFLKMAPLGSYGRKSPALFENHKSGQTPAVHGTSTDFCKGGATSYVCPRSATSELVLLMKIQPNSQACGNFKVGIRLSSFCWAVRLPSRQQCCGNRRVENNNASNLLTKTKQHCFHQAILNIVEEDSVQRKLQVSRRLLCRGTAHN